MAWVRWVFFENKNKNNKSKHCLLLNYKVCSRALEHQEKSRLTFFSSSSSLKLNNKNFSIRKTKQKTLPTDQQLVTTNKNKPNDYPSVWLPPFYPTLPYPTIHQRNNLKLINKLFRECVYLRGWVVSRSIRYIESTLRRKNIIIYLFLSFKLFHIYIWLNLFVILSYNPFR